MNQLDKALASFGSNIANQMKMNGCRLITAFVSAVHDTTIDVVTIDGSERLYNVRLFPVEVIQNGLKRGIYRKPVLHSDVVVCVSGEVGYVIIQSNSEDIVIESDNSLSIGVSSLNEDDSKDCDELELSGKESNLKFTDASAKLSVKHKKESSINIKEELIAVATDKIELGGNEERAIKGDALCSFLDDVLSLISRSTTATLMGTQPLLTASEFITMKAKLESLKSKVVYLK